MTTEKFSMAEKKALQEQLCSYGAKAECVRNTGVQYATIQKVLATGEATEPVIKKLRTYIHVAGMRVYLEDAA